MICFLAIIMCFSFIIPDVEAASYTHGQVEQLIKKKEKEKKKIKKQYNKDKKRVKKANKGKIYIESNGTSVSYGVYMKGYLVIRDFKKDVFYAIKSGRNKLWVIKRNDASYYVSGYVKKTGKVKKKDNIKLFYVKGVNYTKNKYQKKLDKVNKEISDLNSSLKFSYSFVGITDKKYIVGQTYSLNEFVSGDDYYNEPIWVTFDDENGTLTSDGKLTIKKVGNISISIKASVSELVSTETITAEDKVSSSVDILNSNAEVKNVEGGIEINGCAYGDTMQLNVSAASGKTFTFTSSNPELFTVDNTGLLTIHSGGFGGTKEWIPHNSHDYYVTATDGVNIVKFYIYAIKLSFKVSAVYYPNTTENDFTFSTRYDYNDYYASKLYSGDKIQLILDPAPSAGIKYTFKSYNELVTVDSNGLVTMPVQDFFLASRYIVLIGVENVEAVGDSVTFEFLGKPEK